MIVSPAGAARSPRGARAPWENAALVFSRVEIGLLFALPLVHLALLLLYPAPGTRGWDSWMTGTVLASWSTTPWSAIFFFAHPLVIPTTELFSLALPFHDQLFVTAFRECTFSVLTTLVLYLFMRALLRDRIAALLVAASFALSNEIWLAATKGEEKNIMLFFWLLAFVPYAHLRGWVRISWLARLEERSRLYVAALVGAAMALAFCVHTENGLLVLWVALTSLGRRAMLRDFRREARELVVLYGVAGVLTFSFYFPVTWFIVGVRDLDGFARWLFEYHLSGEFVSVDYKFFNRLVEVYVHFRAYVFGDDVLAGADRLQCGLAIALAVAFCWRAARAHRALTVACVVYLGLIGANFFNIVPTSEDWAGASVVGLTVLALASFGMDPKSASSRRWPLRLPWALLCLALLVLDGRAYPAHASDLATVAAANESIYPARFGWLERRFERVIPEAQTAIALDGNMKPDAVVLVQSRHLVNALRIYTDREASAAAYLDRDDAWFHQPRVALTILSRHFYVPALGSSELLSQVAAGRSLYFITRAESVDRRLSARLPGRWQLVRSLSGAPARLFQLAPP